MCVTSEDGGLFILARGQYLAEASGVDDEVNIEFPYIFTLYCSFVP